MFEDDLAETIRTLCDDGHKLQNCGGGLYRCLTCMFELRSIECLKS